MPLTGWGRVPVADGQEICSEHLAEITTNVPTPAGPLKFSLTETFRADFQKVVATR